jgi:DNA-binding NarL/FixJ family response regulator
MMTIQLLLIDSYDFSLLGMRQIIEGDHRMQVGAALADIPMLKAYIGPKPDVIILGEDALQNDPFQMLDLTRQFVPDAYYLLIGRQTDGAVVRDLLQAGVHGYLYAYDALSDVLIYAIDRLIRGQLYLSPTADSAYLLTTQSNYPTWSPDQLGREMLRRLAQGWSIGQIGAALGVPPRQLYRLRDRLRRRFDAQTNEQLIYRAMAQGYNFTDLM